MTLPNQAGWWVDLETMTCLPATPLQYLQRLAGAQEVLGDDLWLVGLDTGPGPHDLRIRTTQPDIAGEIPTVEIMREWMRQGGFEEVPGLRIGAYDALAFRRGPVWLFDARPMNFVEREGDLYPIDLIVVVEPSSEG